MPSSSSRKRIAIFGLPGSGKSTFGAKLAKALNLPLYHLDRYYFTAGWKERNREEFLNFQAQLVAKERWIIEGNSIASLELRFERAEEILYFCFPRLLCLWRVLKRPISYDDSLKDSPEGCSKAVSWKLLKYLWNFRCEKQAQIEALQARYPQVRLIVIRSSKEADLYLEQLKSISLVKP